MTSVLAGYGISILLPPGWEGRITQLSPVEPLPRRVRVDAIPPGPEVTKPTVHITNMPLPTDNDSFGGGVVGHLGPENIFVALVEYSAECVGTALFAPKGIPRSLSARSFNRRALQQIIPGQAGHQSFFTTSNRAFCLYVVMGSYQRVGSLVHPVNRVLRLISVSEQVPSS